MTRTLAGLRALIPAFLLAVPLVPAGGQDAHACSCAQPLPTQAEAIQSSPYVFDGRVTEVRRVPRPDGPGEDVTVIVSVTERWKGEVPDQVAVVGQTGFNSCSWVPPSVGRSRTFYAGRWPDGRGFTPPGACTGGGYSRDPQAREVLALYRSGRAEVEAATAAAPASPEAWLARGRFLEDWKEATAAANAFATAARLAPRSAAAHAGWGRALYEAGRLDDAKAVLRHALALSPRDAEAARFLAMARLRTGERDGLAGGNFRGIRAQSQSYAGLDLRGADFVFARLLQVSFDGADLRGALFNRATISGSFVGARLDGAQLDYVSALHADFREASLRRVAAPGANLNGAATAGARFDGANLSGATFHGSGRPIEQVRGTRDTDFADANLSNASFQGADLRGSDLSRANIAGADFRSAFFDCRTRFPRGFQPDAAGMTGVDPACPGAPPSR